MLTGFFLLQHLGSRRCGDSGRGHSLRRVPPEVSSHSVFLFPFLVCFPSRPPVTTGSFREYNLTVRKFSRPGGEKYSPRFLKNGLFWKVVVFFSFQVWFLGFYFLWAEVFLLFFTGVVWYTTNIFAVGVKMIYSRLIIFRSLYFYKYILTCFGISLPVRFVFEYI